MRKLKMNPKRWLAAGVLALAAVGASVAVLAGGSSDQATASDSFARFQQCMSDAGAQMPTPGEAPQAGDSGTAAAPPQIDARTQAAMQSCSQYAPSGAPGGPGGPDGTGGMPPSGAPPSGMPPATAPDS
jgi:hypothetical protein